MMEFAEMWKFLMYGMSAGIIFKLMIEIFFYAVNVLIGLFRNKLFQ